LNGVLSQGTDIGNEGVGEACLTQERLRDVSFRPQEGICPDGRRSLVEDSFQSLHRSQVNISKDRLSYLGSAEGSYAAAGSGEGGLAEGGSAEVGFSEGGSAEVREYQWMFASPCIPWLYSLMEKIKLLLVCHSVHLLCGALIIERCKPIRKIAHCF